MLRTARYLATESETVEFGEVHVFVGRNFVVTVRHGEASALAVVFTVEDQLAEGEKVKTRWSAQGTHQGEGRGFPRKPCRKP